MRRSGILIWSIVITLALSVGAGAIAVAAQSRSGDPAQGVAGADPAVAEWPGWTVEVVCGWVPFDPLVAFADPADAERGHSPAEIALRRYLAKSRHYFPPSKPHGWRLLVETSDYAEFGRGELSRGGVEVNTFRRGKKDWDWSGSSSSCQPQVLRDNQVAITWTLARGQSLTPSTRTVKVDLGPGECASGASQDKRLERPEFREEDGALLMALWIHPVPALGPHEGYTCVGTIEPPVKIRLPEALGKRELLDGGVFPPISSAHEIRREEGI
jgi:hypothetical protein